MKFIDEATIIVESGPGGDGCISFRREKFVPRGGPDGGNGGEGGSVWLVGAKGLTTLYDLKIRPHYRAGRGQHGKGKARHGRNGEDVLIAVPAGVVVFEDARIVGEILKPGERLLATRGGRGGRGNAHFVSSTNRAPRKAEPGMAGVKKKLKIVLKLISDIGIVGLPNAGKSTLLRAMTNARPRIGRYPFTTLSPNLGVLRSETDRAHVIIADMPGIIKDAHRGKGIGLQFLRHIERTNLLVIVLDAAAPDAAGQYATLLEEFTRYDRRLLEKRRVVVLNKIDLLDRLPRLNVPDRVFFVSALTGAGVEALIAHLQDAN